MYKHVIQLLSLACNGCMKYEHTYIRMDVCVGMGGWMVGWLLANKIQIC